MKNIINPKLATVFLLKCGVIIGIVFPVLAVTSKQNNPNNINYAAFWVISIISIGVGTAGLGFQLKKSQNECKKLEEQLANTNSEIAKLKQESNSLQEEAQKKRNRIQELEKTLKKHQENLARQMKIKQQLEREIKLIQSKLAELETSKRNSREKLLSKEVEITTLETQLKQQKSELSQQARELERELAERNSQLDLQTENLENIQQIIEQTQLQLAELEDLDRASQDRLQNKELEIDRLKEKLQQEESQLNENLVKLQQELADKNSLVALQTEKINKLQQEVEPIKLQIKRLKDSEQNSQQITLGKELEIIKLQEQLKQQKSELSQQARELERELAERNSQLDLQTENLENLQQIIEQTQLQLAELEDSDRASQDRLQNKELEIDRLKEKLKQEESQLNENLVKLQQELADKNSLVALQTEKINNLQQLITQTQSKLQQIEDSEKTSKEALANKELEITRLRANLKQQESQFADNKTKLERELAERNSQLDLQTKNIENFQQQIKHIQAQIDRFEKDKASSQFTIKTANVEKDREYERLILFLSTGKWQKANRETSNIMLKITNKEKDLRLNSEAIKNFPKDKFQELDRLWNNYSQGRFSFSTQLKIWDNIGGFPEVYESNLYQQWAEIVGWYSNGSWQVYSGLNFSIDAPVGQFPAISLSWSDWGAAWCGKETIELFSKIEPIPSQENESHKVNPETINLNNIVDKGKNDIEKGIQDISKGLKEFGDSF
ncbi:MAG: GUN4 domain-containing protein [Prochloraceae cyanobacterium]